MTRPSGIRPKEGQQPGAPFESFHAGGRLPPMRFTLDGNRVAVMVGDAGVPSG